MPWVGKGNFPTLLLLKIADLSQWLETEVNSSAIYCIVCHTCMAACPSSIVNKQQSSLKCWRCYQRRGWWKRNIWWNIAVRSRGNFTNQPLWPINWGLALHWTLNTNLQQQPITLDLGHLFGLYHSCTPFLPAPLVSAPCIIEKPLAESLTRSVMACAICLHPNCSIQPSTQPRDSVPPVVY